MRFLNFFRTDFRSSIVVFLVAIPLCLGIAVASGAPVVSGLISGIVGGIVVGMLSKSPLSVSGPAAGLVAIVLMAIDQLGSYEAFLLSVIVGGGIQLIMGFLRAGSIGHFFPSSVISGMLAAIGIILILKQLPHALGFDLDYMGDLSFFQVDDRNTFTELIEAISHISWGALFISVISLFILSIWNTRLLRKVNRVPAPLVVVVMAVFINILYKYILPNWELKGESLVQLPSQSSVLTFPDFSSWANVQVYVVGLTIAIVASIETLLCIEACDKLDSEKRITPLNRELRAQGVGNIISGFLGGLPITSVIVRSSANFQAGAISRASTISHGVLLWLTLLLFAQEINRIPQAALAAILLQVGYKLTRLSLFQYMYKQGFVMFIPFVVTIVWIVFSDLLQGVFIGLGVACIFILVHNYRRTVLMIKDDNKYLIRFTSSVSFLNKRILRHYFRDISANSQVVIDGSRARFIDKDIYDVIHDFIAYARAKNISVELINIKNV